MKGEISLKAGKTIEMNGFKSCIEVKEAFFRSPDKKKKTK
jgi:hypothetical protein